MSSVSNDEETVQLKAFRADLHASLFGPHGTGDISDIVLVSKDGDHVHAHRTILSLRSRYFRELLYGDNGEGEQKKVNIELSGTVLRAVVSYMYGGTIYGLWEDASEFKGYGDREDLSFVINVMYAAEAIECHNLSFLCRQRIAEIAVRDADLVCIAFQSVERFMRVRRGAKGNSSFKVLANYRTSLLQLIWDRPLRTLIGTADEKTTALDDVFSRSVRGRTGAAPGIMEMDVETLEIFVANTAAKAHLTQEYIFRLVLFWWENFQEQFSNSGTKEIVDEKEGDTPSNAWKRHFPFWWKIFLELLRSGYLPSTLLLKEGSSTCGVLENSRKKVCKIVRNYLRPSEMSVKFVTSVVCHSGIMEKDQICSGLRILATTIDEENAQLRDTIEAYVSPNVSERKI